MNSFTSNSENTISERAMARRFLFRYALPFILIMVATALVWDYVLREAVIFRTETHGAAKLNRALQPHEGEVPVFGSSRALSSYIPDSIAPNVYNYGINGIGYQVIDLFLEQELESEKKTPIILNFDYGMFMGSLGDFSSFLPLTGVEKVRSLLQRSNLYQPYYRVPGLRLYGGFDGYMREFLNQEMQMTKWVTKGAALEKNKLPAENFAKLVKQRMEEQVEWTPDTNLTKALEQRIIQGADRKFWVVVAPYHSSYYHSFKPDHWRQAQHYLRKLDRFPNAQVIEIRGDDWPDSLFTNTTHINLQGAVRFCEELRLAMTAIDSSR